MKLKIIDPQSPYYEAALSLRYRLFFQEHDLPWSILFDDKEATSTHLALIDGENLVAYGRLSSDADMNFQISQMVVDPKHQGRGYGTEVLERLIALTREMHGNSIFLNARISAIAFYEKMGFIAFGEPFKSKSTQVEHIKMKLELIG